MQFQLSLINTKIITYTSLKCVILKIHLDIHGVVKVLNLYKFCSSYISPTQKLLSNSSFILICSIMQLDLLVSSLYINQHYTIYDTHYTNVMRKRRMYQSIAENIAPIFNKLFSVPKSIFTMTLNVQNLPCHLYSIEIGVLSQLRLI